MTDVAIHAEGVAKSYKIGANQSVNRSLREILVNTVNGPIRRAKNLLNGQAYGATDMTETIWALEDISFEVKHGEVIGIIGHNGAGKSTLLKILSNITEPTKGYIDVYGRVGALLEVGTGFHEELTGRENIYLNGSILGMGRSDIDSRLDEIIDFSGVERFLDTPVKYYSSGMKLRLGFAVAAHLEPEILVVDEVLAVGDAAFQRKCLGKMQSVAGEGRTVLFVSHNMDAVSSLTERALLLGNGRIIAEGPSQHIVEEYLRQLGDYNNTGYIDLHKMGGCQHSDVSLDYVRTLNRDHNETNSFFEQDPVDIRIGLTVHKPLQTFLLGCSFNYARYGQTIFTVPSDLYENVSPGPFELQLNLSPAYFASGDFEVIIKFFVNDIRQENIRDIFFKVIAHSQNTEMETLQKWVAGPIRLTNRINLLPRLIENP